MILKFMDLMNLYLLFIIFGSVDILITSHEIFIDISIMYP